MPLLAASSYHLNYTSGGDGGGGRRRRTGRRKSRVERRMGRKRKSSRIQVLSCMLFRRSTSEEPLCTVTWCQGKFGRVFIGNLDQEGQNAEFGKFVHWTVNLLGKIPNWLEAFKEVECLGWGKQKSYGLGNNGQAFNKNNCNKRKCLVIVNS